MLRVPLLVSLISIVGVHEGHAGGAFDVVAYRVVIRPDILSHSIDGQTQIVVERRGPGDGEVSFGLNGLVVSEVLVDTKPQPIRIHDDRLDVAIPGELGADPVTLAVTYHGQPSQGLVFGPDYVRSTWGSNHWMICDERPGQRARFEIELIVPRDYEVVASGEPVAKRFESPSLTRHVWRQARPYPSYLFGFAAGRLTKASGAARKTRLEYFGIEDGPEALRRKFRDTARMLEFFEDRSGVSFPNPTYSQVLVPGSEAQEASSFSLIGKEFLDPILENPQEDWVIAHELAHQWWGNLLTCATWKDFWLNEGVTTFMVAAYKEKRWGKAAYAREMELSRKRYQKAIDAGFEVPLTFDGKYPSLGIKRSIVYSKGALFLDALRKEIGEKAFWSGLRAYTRACAGRSVESREFQDAMEKSAQRSLAAIFEKWVYG
jgi:aminopeptidase N